MKIYNRLSFSHLFVITLLLSAGASRADLSAVGYAQYSGLSENLFLTSLFIDGSVKNSGIVKPKGDVRRLEFKFLSEQITFRRFKQLLLQSSAINNSADVMKKNTQAINEFVNNTRLKGGFSRGDHLVFETNGHQVTTRVNDVTLSVIVSTDLFDIFLNSWVGKIPPSRDFKEALLGKDEDLYAARMFNKLSFSESRRKEVLLSQQPSSKVNDLAIVEPKVNNLDNTTRQDEKNHLAKANNGPEVNKLPAQAITVASADLEAINSQSSTELSDAELLGATVAKPQSIAADKIDIKQNVASLEDKPKAILVDKEFKKARKIRNQYSKALYVHASKNISYPRRSRQLNQTGKVLAQVTIDRDGNLIDVEIERKSDHNSLNRAVQKALKKSQPYPDVPQDIGGDAFIFEVPVTFAL